MLSEQHFSEQHARHAEYCRFGGMLLNFCYFIPRLLQKQSQEVYIKFKIFMEGGGRGDAPAPCKL